MLKTVAPDETAVTKARAAAAALLKLCPEGSTTELVRDVVAVGTEYASEPTAIVTLKQADYSLADPTPAKHQLAEGMAGAGFERVLCDSIPSIACTWEGQQMHVVLCGDSHAGVPQLLDPTLSHSDREALACGTIAVSAAFLQQQPALYRTAARVAYLWARKQLNGMKVARAEGRHFRSFEYLIDLLVLHAYQAYVATVGPGKPASDAAALDAILCKFLELLPRLQGDSGHIIWDMHYTRHTAKTVLTHPALAKLIRPQYCETHPIVLDPANPTNNVALALTLEQLAALAAAASAAASAGQSSIIKTLQQVPVLASKVDMLPGQLQGEVNKVDTRVSSIEHRLDAFILYQRLANQSQQRLAKQSQSSSHWARDQPDFWRLDPEPLTVWLPQAGVHPVMSPTMRTKSGMELAVYARPMQTSDDTDKEPLWFGIELRMAAGSPVMMALADIKLPLTAKICEGSRITLDSLDVDAQKRLIDLNRYRIDVSQQSVATLQQDISASLTRESGPRWMLSQHDAWRLRLCSDTSKADSKRDTALLQAHVQAGCKVILHLNIQVNIEVSV